MVHTNMTVVALKAEAKARGLRGYSKLRKVELLRLLNGSHVDQLQNKKVAPDDIVNIMDAPVPDIEVRALTPSKYVANIMDTPVPHIKVQTLKPSKYVPISYVNEIYGSTKSVINKFADWIISYIPTKPMRIVNEGLDALKSKVNDIFKKPNKEKLGICESKSALKGFSQQYTIDGIEGIDAVSFISKVRPLVVGLLSKKRMNKINLVLTCVMEKVDTKTGEITTVEAPFCSKTEINLKGTDVNDFYKNASDKCLESMAIFQRQGSNWRFVAVRKMEVNTVIYNPLKGSSYIPLPSYLAKKKAIINMKNDDDQCFKWCVTRALNPVDKDQEKVNENLKIQAEQLDWKGVKFPVDLCDIDRFENRNEGIGIHVFGFESQVYPLRLSKTRNSRIVILMLISNGETRHYCLIKSLSRLLTSQTGGHTLIYCVRCLQGYRDKEALDKHYEYCKEHEAVAIKLPVPGTMIRFKNYYRSMRVPFIVYADFESFNKPIASCQPNPGESYTNKYQKHSPSSFCYFIKCFDDNVYAQYPVSYTAKSEDDDVAQIFIDTLERNIREIYNEFRFPKRMIFTTEDARKYKDTGTCHICGGCEFSKDKDRKSVE